MIDPTYEHLIDTIKKVRDHLWEFKDRQDPQELDAAEKLCNDAIDPTFDQTETIA